LQTCSPNILIYQCTVGKNLASKRADQHDLEMSCKILHTILQYPVRVVLDTDVLVAAVRSPKGASRWLLRAALEGGIEIVVSVPLILEYEAVLTRPEHLSGANLTAQEMIAVIDAVAVVGLHARFSFRWRPLLRDANDDMVLETAINGGVGLLVTFNVRDFGSAGEPFGCRAVLPNEATKVIRGN
jgi:putative PIN family toxin of toxin-antitoxin system